MEITRLPEDSRLHHCIKADSISYVASVRKRSPRCSANRVKSSVAEQLTRLIDAYVGCVFDHPWMFIFIPFILSVLLGSGLARRTVANDAQRLYALPKSNAVSDRKAFEELFDITRPQQIIIRSHNSSNILTKTFLDHLWAFHKGVLSITADARVVQLKTLPIDVRQPSRAKQAANRRLVSDDAPPPLTWLINATIPVLRPLLIPYALNRNFSSHLSTVPGPEDSAILVRPTPPRTTSISETPMAQFMSRRANQTSAQTTTATLVQPPKGLKFTDELTRDFVPHHTPLPHPSHRTRMNDCHEATESYIPLSWGDLCAHDSIHNKCKLPMGVLWMYEDRKSFGRPLNYPVLVNRRTAQAFTVDMWVHGNHVGRGQSFPYSLGNTSYPFEQTYFHSDATSHFHAPQNASNANWPIWLTHLMSVNVGNGTLPAAPEEPQRMPRKGLSVHPLQDIVNAEVLTEATAFRMQYELFEPSAKHLHRLTARIHRRKLQQGILFTEAKNFSLSLDSLKDATRQWEENLVKFVTEYRGLEGADVFVAARHSLNDELASSVTVSSWRDLGLMSLTAFCFFLYVMLITSSFTTLPSSTCYRRWKLWTIQCHNRTKIVPGLMGAVAAVLGYIGGVGLCSLCGLEHTATANATPFLVLGVGVDDVFVMLNAYSLTYEIKCPRQRCTVTLRDCGLSITTTTLTNLLAFAVGASSPYMAIRNFCIFTASGLFAGYILALTLLVGFLCTDGVREDEGESIFSWYFCLKGFRHKRRPPSSMIDTTVFGFESSPADIETELQKFEHPSPSCPTTTPSDLVSFLVDSPSNTSSRYQSHTLSATPSQSSTPDAAVVTLNRSFELSRRSFWRSETYISQSPAWKDSPTANRPTFLCAVQNLSLGVYGLGLHFKEKQDDSLRIALGASTDSDQSMATTTAHASRYRHIGSCSKIHETKCAMIECLQRSWRHTLPMELYEVQHHGHPMMAAPSIRGSSELNAAPLHNYPVQIAYPSLSANFAYASLPILLAAESLQAVSSVAGCKNDDSFGCVASSRQHPSRTQAKKRFSSRRNRARKTTAMGTCNRNWLLLVRSRERRKARRKKNKHRDEHPNNLRTLSTFANVAKRVELVMLDNGGTNMTSSSPASTVPSCNKSVIGFPTDDRSAIASSNEGCPFTIYRPTVLSNEVQPNLFLPLHSSPPASLGHSLPTDSSDITTLSDTRSPWDRKLSPSCFSHITADRSGQKFRTPPFRRCSKVSSEVVYSSSPPCALDPQNDAAYFNKRQRNIFELEGCDTWHVSSIKEANAKRPGFDEPDGNVGRHWRSMFLNYYGYLLPLRSLKLLVLIIFGIYLAFAIIGSMRLKRGLDIRNLAPDDSYLRNFFRAQDSTFGEYGDDITVFFDAHNLQWASIAYRRDYSELHNRLESAYYTMAINDGMYTFFNLPEVSRTLAASPSQNKMVEQLYAWAQEPTGRVFDGAFVWTNSTTTERQLRGWRLRVISRNFKDSDETALFMQRIRRDCVVGAAKGRAFSNMFLFYESDIAILPATLQNVAVAAVAVMAISLTLLPVAWLGLVVVISLLSIGIGVFGYMSFWGIQLNMLSMVNIIMAIGFSVDYSVHICHTFSHCHGKTRNHRVTETLVLMGTPIMHGVLSTMLAITCLAFTTSYTLRVFFKMMTLVLGFGALHGLLFLPVALSVMGPLVEPLEDAKNELSSTTEAKF